ncbi:MAG: acyltransferase [Clostridia bacterium]|nr:acyltransferase [Clostridia bacterium]MBR6741259.1 acyltransferase [Clostridia bacterium]
MNKLNRFIYVDLLRVIASVMVVAVHVAVHYIGIFKVGSIPWTMLDFIIASTKFAVPVFFMLSGAVILSSTREETYWQFIKRRLLKVAVPFLSYSVIAYLYFCFVKETYDFGVVDFIKRFIGGDIIGHLWYLYALIPFYFLLPIFRKFVRAVNRKELLIFITIMFCLNSGLPFLNNLLGVFSDFKITYYSFSYAGAYLNYVLIGYYIHTYVDFREKANRKSIGYLLLYLCCIVFITIMTYIVSEGKLNTSWYNISMLPVGISSIAIVLSVKAWLTNHNVGERLAAAISKLGMLSFSAYLIHMLILRVIQTYIPASYLDTLSTPKAAVFILAEFVIALVCSYLWSFAVSKIPVVKKIL